MNIHKRTTLRALALCLGAAHIGSVWAADEGVMLKADSIVKSLSKDIVLDQPSTAAGPSQARPQPSRPQPSVNLNVQFAYNSAELLPQGRRQLDELGMALKHKSLMTWGFELAGHTDAAGSADYNLRLSLERANAVKQYLVVQHGLNPERLIPLGFGFTRLANPAQPLAAVNRRVEVRRVALATQPTGAVEPVFTPAPSPVPVAPATAPAVTAPAGGRLVSTP